MVAKGHEWRSRQRLQDGRATDTPSSEFTVTGNSRPANVPLGGVMLNIGENHQWITANEGKSAGMGPLRTEARFQEETDNPRWTIHAGQAR